ncbi:deoxyribonuclease gamma-like protein [Lates japonicus]|uniref:Deoxyribonuclease-1-like 1 n=1 Tax=Lates japonicus TaxID=270547 RepID=A0AAD3M1E5_LATJO|nr:deoxyribonuclease gamma-like protein [Lates japonicus]
MDSWQTTMSNFYMTYKILSQLIPILPGLFLARLGDRGWRKMPIVVPLIGLILSRLVMLLMLTLDWPLEVLWVEVTLKGLCGGFVVFWGGSMTLLSLSSAEQDRSKLMMTAELTNGIAGVVGCVASGHLFDFTTVSLRPGVMTMVVCLLLFAFCVLYTIFFLEVGYGNASGFLIVLSSFLSAMVMSRWVSELTLITIGLLSYTAGIFFMTSVTTTYMFYIGIVLTSLQLSLKVSSAGYSLLYIKIYQHTLNWFPGLVFIISGIITTVAIIPISYDSKHKYDAVASERLGRSESYQEQYVFVYRTDTVTVTGQYQYPDNRPGDVDAFSREPFVVRFKAPKTVIKEFVLIPQHTTPTNTTKELDALYDVLQHVKKMWKTENVMLLGDFNADCGYLAKKNRKHVRLITEKSLIWLIEDEIDTTVRSTTSCTYDRIVVHGERFAREIVPLSAKPFDFQREYGLTEEQALEVSDHYPVEVLLKVVNSKLFFNGATSLALTGTKETTSKSKFLSLFVLSYLVSQVLIL